MSGSAWAFQRIVQSSLSHRSSRVDAVESISYTGKVSTFSRKVSKAIFLYGRFVAVCVGYAKSRELNVSKGFYFALLTYSIFQIGPLSYHLIPVCKIRVVKASRLK